MIKRFVISACLLASAGFGSPPAVDRDRMDWTCLSSPEASLPWSFDVSISLANGSATFSNLKGLGNTKKFQSAVVFTKMQSPMISPTEYAPVVIYSVNSKPSSSKSAMPTMLATYKWTINNWTEQKFISDSAFGIVKIAGKGGNFECDVFNYREESK